MTTPERVWDKSPFHHLVRLTNTEKYEDNSQLGNRVLAIWVGKNAYHYTTYDKTTNKPSIHQDAKYDDFLEGHWNYIYFSYSAAASKAVGFVHFGDLEGNQVQRVEFVNVQHVPLNGYARVVVANKEFGYVPFNGMIKNFRLYLGKGFVDQAAQLQKNVLALFPKPDLKVP